LPVNVSTALIGLAIWGLKVTVNGALWPAGTVSGSERPPTLNTELLEVAAVTVTFAPLAVRLPEAVPLLPATTLPRFSVVGATVNFPTVVVPVPESGIVNAAFDAVEVIVTFPLTAPADCGVNETLRVALWSAVKVKGAVTPLKVNPVPLIAIAETVTLEPPEFVTVSDRVCLFPRVTLPKSRLRVPRDTVPLCCWFEAPELTPWHPTRQVRPATISPTRITFQGFFGEASTMAFFRVASYESTGPLIY
jgi:hypothetical protein